MKRFTGVWKSRLILAISCVSILGTSGCNKETVANSMDIGKEENVKIESETTESKVEENVVIDNVITESETAESEAPEEVSIENITAEYAELMATYTDECLVDILVEDFESNGKFSAFVITCANYSAEQANMEDYEGVVYPAKVWFLTETSCTMLEEDIQYMDFSLEGTEFSNGLKPIMFHTWLSGSSDMGTFYLVEEGVPTRLGELEYAQWYEGDMVLESVLERKMQEDGSMPIVGERKSTYKIEQGQLVLVDSWVEEY